MNWRQRAGRLRRLLDSHTLDGMLVNHPPNIRYLTGFTGTAGVLLVEPEGMVFLTDFRYEEQAALEVADRARVEIVEGDPRRRAWELVAEMGTMSSVGFESHATTVAEAESVPDPGGDWLAIPLREQIEALRVVKEPEEVAVLARAAAVATEALDVVLQGKLVVGRRELDVAADLERELRVRGSEWHPFRTIVASGPRTALPHAGTSERVIETGDLVLLDFGARVDGYCSDITRTVVMGRAQPRQREIYEVVRTAQQNACNSIGAGMPGCDADAVARVSIEAAGLGERFGHSLGHGLGLEVHEAPRLARTNPDPLPANSVVTVEPGVYFPGWGGVRIEDDVYLGDGGTEMLSHYSTELIEIN